MQVEAERKKRAAVLESEGKKYAAVNVAEGEKQGTFLKIFILSIKISKDSCLRSHYARTN